MKPKHFENKAPACSLLKYQLDQLQRPLIIGVAGDSGSGKSTFSNGIRRLLGTDLVGTITLDDYHKEDRKQRKKSGRLPLDPDANHLDLVQEHLSLLKQGKQIQKPVYNHTTGEFDPLETFTPKPVVVMEGLHTLYPDLMDYYDFTIFVDPDREVKWRWKYDRDVTKRGHDPKVLEQEMLKREAAFKRWIDFQKTGADVVVKIHMSDLHELARNDYQGELPECHHMILIMASSSMSLKSLRIPIDLGRSMEDSDLPFQLAAVPSLYWGRRVNAIHIDGVLSAETVEELEQQIVNCTAIPVEQAIAKLPHEQTNANAFAQLLITWRFLERLNHLLSKT